MSASDLASRSRALKSGTPFASRQKELWTTHAVLEIPADVTVLEVLPAEGTTFETAKQGDRITSITWKKAIPPKASAEFVFRARNPAAGEIVWKAHQHFSDGTVADWAGVAGDKRPASVPKLNAQSAAGAQSDDAAAIENWLKGYDAAFNAKTSTGSPRSPTLTSRSTKAAASTTAGSLTVIATAGQS